MALIDINSLTLKTDLKITDETEVYNLSGASYVPQTIAFADLSSYFFSAETFEALSAKYGELVDLINSFKKFLADNYPQQTELSGILATTTDLNNVIQQLQTIDTAKRDYLNDYATYNYAENKKSTAYAYHETLAAGISELRKSILGSVMVDPED